MTKTTRRLVCTPAHFADIPQYFALHKGSSFSAPDARLGRGKDASPIPKEWAANIQNILFTEQQIQDKVKELATQISKKYAGKKILAVGLLNGAFVFVADLLRNLTVPYQVRFGCYVCSKLHIVCAPCRAG